MAIGYTTFEQSKKLFELGLSPESADMYWFRDNTKTPKVFPKDMMHNSVSVTYLCWTVGRLIELMPEIEYGNYPKAYPKLNRYDGYQFDHYCYVTQYHENLIGAAFEMVCWLLENGYIKKGE